MTRNSRHRAIAAAAFLAAALTLTGCGAGSDAITNMPYSPTEALSVKTKEGIDISQAFFLGPDSGGTLPAGAATPLYLSLVNTNGPDELVGLGVDPALGTAKVSAPVPLPQNQLVSVGKPTPTILIEGLKKPLRGGEAIPVQLQFANAGVVQLTIPVITRSREFTAYPQVPGASAAPTPTPTPSASAEEGHGH
ncbi:copper chaperone PCu(A)C [Streptosporangium sp. NBC_01755]|uniref:copper chaperone PCu(A)C n=1 Tax=unclassified Streptosporangium TaxID=2632669 RepID=UPI002DDA4FF4|nr:MULTISPECIES: copper chaperone PCu(A)C [unclassified Streptosporangium]WSA24531.1 copper chaperone PCu(A)C [Streptosporangium sp. NBC_01810]WSC97395.1 copper chaperone PCu(A)C [Streptosporangium sp. NBC_01755]